MGTRHEGSGGPTGKRTAAVARVLRVLRGSPAVDEGFLRENRLLFVPRTRVLILVASGLLLASIPVDYFRVPHDLYPDAVARRLLGLALLLPLLPVLSSRFAERRAAWLAGIVFLVLTAITLSMAPLFEKGAADPNYAVQVMGTVFLVMGSALLLPFDGRTMALLGGILLLLHVGITTDFALSENFPALFATFAAVLVATVGAHLLYEGRLSDYEARLAQSSLLAAKEEVVRVQETLMQVRGDFVAMLTHDIKNPLSTVLGFTELLRERLREGGDLREAVDGIESSAQQAMALAVNFLDVDRIQRGALELRREPVSLNDVVEHVLRHQAPRSRIRRVVLRSDLHPDLPPLDLDEPLVDRVLANLVGNALKFAPEGTEVVVTTRLDEGRVVVEVRDRGPGISPDERARLFQRYAQGAGSGTESTGLGLFIVKSIVEAHAGRVDVHCPSEGGSVFEISFPVNTAG